MMSTSHQSGATPSPELRSRAAVIGLVERGAHVELGRYLRSNPIIPQAEREVLQRFERGELNSTTAAKELMALPPRS